MNKFLIGGRAGSGKSTIQKNLSERGYNAFDADEIPGLSAWRDLKTGQIVHVNPGDFVDYSKVGWIWDSDMLKRILDTDKSIFICGSASNDVELLPLFNKVIVLTLDPQTQLSRLQPRNSPYGKNPEMQKIIIAEQAEFAEQAVKLGALAIDNTRALDTVVDEILKTTIHES